MTLDIWCWVTRKECWTLWVLCMLQTITIGTWHFRNIANIEEGSWLQCSLSQTTKNWINESANWSRYARAQSTCESVYVNHWGKFSVGKVAQCVFRWPISKMFRYILSTIGLTKHGPMKRLKGTSMGCSSIEAWQNFRQHLQRNLIEAETRVISIY